MNATEINQAIQNADGYYKLPGGWHTADTPLIIDKGDFTLDLQGCKLLYTHTQPMIVVSGTEKLRSVNIKGGFTWADGAAMTSTSAAFLYLKGVLSSSFEIEGFNLTNGQAMFWDSDSSFDYGVEECQFNRVVAYDCKYLVRILGNRNSCYNSIRFARWKPSNVDNSVGISIESSVTNAHLDIDQFVISYICDRYCAGVKGNQLTLLNIKHMSVDGYGGENGQGFRTFDGVNSNLHINRLHWWGMNNQTIKYTGSKPKVDEFWKEGIKTTW